MWFRTNIILFYNSFISDCSFDLMLILDWHSIPIHNSTKCSKRQKHYTPNQNIRLMELLQNWIKRLITCALKQILCIAILKYIICNNQLVNYDDRQQKYKAYYAYNKQQCRLFFWIHKLYLLNGFYYCWLDYIQKGEYCPEADKHPVENLIYRMNSENISRECHQNVSKG